MSSLMAQVTADLYDWQIFVFAWATEKEWLVDCVWGCLNSRQVFIGFMSTGMDPTDGQPNHWQPIFPLVKFYQFELRDSEYRAHPPAYNTKEFDDFESLIKSDTAQYPETTFEATKKIEKGLYLLGGHKWMPGAYKQSIFGSDLGYITSSSWRDSHPISSQRVVPERLIPPAICFVSPQLTMASVQEHLGMQGLEKSTECAIMAFLMGPASTLPPLSKSSNTGPLPKADMSANLQNHTLLQLLHKEGFTPPFSPDLFESDALLKAMVAKGHVREFAEMLYLYTRGGSLPV